MQAAGLYKQYEWTITGHQVETLKVRTEIKWTK